MSPDREPIRVLYSFPLKLGADRICYTAWEQVNGLAKAGAQVLACVGVLHRPVAPSVTVRTTLARGKLRIPYKLLGLLRACALHDYLVAHELEKLADRIDIVHAWPSGALRTLKTAAKLGIPTVLERPNAHTRFGMEVVQRECERLGVTLPRDDSHAYNRKKLRKEEEEFRLAIRLLCPSDFVVKTFLDRGFPREQLARHSYGFDNQRFFPAVDRNEADQFTMLFVGSCAVRKGIHYALEAWLRSPVHCNGKFLIAGEFLPDYKDKLSGMLSDPSVHVLGHRDDVAELMRNSDVLVLPTIEEGSPLVALEAMGSGCVPLVSDVCAGTCRHMENALVHDVGDVSALSQQITMLYENRVMLKRLSAAALKASRGMTWTAAGKVLLNVYQEMLGIKESDGRLQAVSQ